MATAALLSEILAGLLFAGSGIAMALVTSALLLGYAISMDAEQREPIPRATAPILPERYARRVRGSSTLRTTSPRMCAATDAATRLPPMIASRASSSRF